MHKLNKMYEIKKIFVHSLRKYHEIFIFRGVIRTMANGIRGHPFMTSTQKGKGGIYYNLYELYFGFFQTFQRFNKITSINIKI